MMSKHCDRRFEYSLDLQDVDGTWGMWGFKAFRDGNEALSYAENLADTNREVIVTINITPLDRGQWPRKAS